MDWSTQDMNLLSFINFCVGLKNLDLNISQDDLQRTSKALDDHLKESIEKIQNHLEIQDQKIDYIISLLEDH